MTDQRQARTHDTSRAVLAAVAAGVDIAEAREAWVAAGRPNLHADYSDADAVEALHGIKRRLAAYIDTGRSIPLEEIVAMANAIDEILRADEAERAASRDMPLWSWPLGANICGFGWADRDAAQDGRGWPVTLQVMHVDGDSGCRDYDLRPYAPAGTWGAARVDARARIYVLLHGLYDSVHEFAALSTSDTPTPPAALDAIATTLKYVAISTIDAISIAALMPRDTADKKE